MEQFQIDQAKLNTVLAAQLEVGQHQSFDKGMCVMEAVAYIAGEPWSDHPRCACPVIASFLRAWEDRLPDDERQQLKQYIPQLVGSRISAQVERKRSWMLTDWTVRECAPRWLRAAGMTEQASILASLPRLTNAEIYSSAAWDKYWKFRDKIYNAIQKSVRKAVQDKYGDVRAEAQASAHALVRRLLETRS